MAALFRGYTSIVRMEGTTQKSSQFSATVKRVLPESTRLQKNSVKFDLSLCLQIYFEG